MQAEWKSPWLSIAKTMPRSSDAGAQAADLRAVGRDEGL